jgi:hypothetical protein
MSGRDNIEGKTGVPHEAMENYEFAPLDYSDAYRIRLEEGSSLSMTELAHNVFGEIASYPVYVRFLLRLRDLLVRPFGLYTMDDMAEITEPSDWIGFFRIYQISENEIIIGADDKHLDVRVSLLRTVHDDNPFLTVSTFVRLNNFLGKIYFAIIKPFHRIIVPATIKKSMRKYKN